MRAMKPMMAIAGVCAVMLAMTGMMRMRKRQMSMPKSGMKMGMRKGMRMGMRQRGRSSR